MRLPITANHDGGFCCIKTTKEFRNWSAGSVGLKASNKKMIETKEKYRKEMKLKLNIIGTTYMAYTNC